MKAPLSHRRVPQRHGFTLLEVLMVIAVILILMAIIIPALGGAQTSARKAKTRAQFAQWATAIEQFRQEYGYYPNWGTTDAGDSFLNGKIDSDEKTKRFVQCLSGRKLDGNALIAGDPGLTAGNTKRISFCAFGSDNLNSSNELQDAFGNSEIVVLMDKNLSGVITFGLSQDYSGVTDDVDSVDGETVTSPVTSTTIIRAGVAFYSAGDGKTAVTSW